MQGRKRFAFKHYCGGIGGGVVGGIVGAAGFGGAAGKGGGLVGGGGDVCCFIGGVVYGVLELGTGLVGFGVDVLVGTTAGCGVLGEGVSCD